MAEQKVRSLADLESYARDLARDFSERTILLLDGPMGVGKTELVKILARLHGAGDVSSPTFAIHQRYEGPHGFSLDHLDVYRIKNSRDLDSTGFWDFFGDPQGLIVIEWAKKLGISAWPPGWKVVSLEMDFGSIEGERRIRRV